jgi:hypothetical protein
MGVGERGDDRRRGEGRLVPAAPIAERKLQDAVNRAVNGGRKSHVLHLPPGREIELSSTASLPSSLILKPGPGSVLKLRESRTFDCRFDFSDGGSVRPDSGASATLNGRVLAPSAHACFDVSLGGVIQPKIGAIPELTPENFGALNDDTTYDDLALRACLAAAEYDSTANRAIHVRLLPGAGYLYGNVLETVAVDWGGTTHYEYIALRVRKGGIVLVGDSAATTSLHFKPVDLGTDALRRYFGIRFEETTGATLQYVGLRGVLLRAGNAIDAAKVGVDLHDVRHSRLDDVYFSNWPHTNKQNVCIRLRGRDAGVLHKIQTQANVFGVPILVDFNDDETAGRDANGLPLNFRADEDNPSLRDNKDLDHWKFHSLDLAFNDNQWKAAILVGPGVVVRNLEISEVAAVRGGGLVMVDRLDSGGVGFAGAAVEPRRASNHVKILSGRTEGMLSGAGHYGIRVERHQNGRLRDLSIDGYQLGEGRDNRRTVKTGASSASGVAWNGLIATGVQRLHLGGDVRYGGTGTPFTVDADCRLALERDSFDRIVAELVPGDRNRLMPEVVAHWTYITNYLGSITAPQHWWLMNETNSAQVQEDQQTSGTDYDLREGGSPTFAQLVDAWHNYTGRFLNVADQKWRMHANSDTPGADTDPATTSVALLGVYTIDNAWVPDLGVASGVSDLLNLGGTNKGALVRVDPAGSGKLFLRANATDGSLSTRAYNDGVAFIAMLASNRTAGTIKCWLRKFTGESEIITVTDTTTMDNGTQKGFGAYSSASSSAKGNLHFGAHFNGAAAEEDGYTLFTALGWRA